MMGWLPLLRQRLAAGAATVRVTVVNVRGSAPREAGATLLVGADDMSGTIGGGHLEWKAISIARDMLAHAEAPAGRVDRFTLGATLGQCCGGALELWFERYAETDLAEISAILAAAEEGSDCRVLTVLDGAVPRHRVLAPEPVADVPDLGDEQLRLWRNQAGQVVLLEKLAESRTDLYLFGAGHVGKALVNVLAGLPVRVGWIDSREGTFPAVVPANVSCICDEDPAGWVARAPEQAMFLVLTHSHDLDYDICRAILERPRMAWAGLIGSQTKAARFRHRFAAQGIPAARSARLVCPIGLPGIGSKLPAAIAVSVAAQLLTVIEAGAHQADAPEHENPATPSMLRKVSE